MFLNKGFIIIDNNQVLYNFNGIDMKKSKIWGNRKYDLLLKCWKWGQQTRMDF